MNDIISVLIPSYNHSEFIIECVNSVISQTYEPIEVIIVDDGSTDNTISILSTLDVACNSRFITYKVIQNKHLGRALTFNTLVKEASGKYLFFLASDDKLKPNAIEELYHKIILDYNFVLAVGNSEFINNNSEIIGWDAEQNSTSVNNAVYKNYHSFLNSAHGIDFSSNEFGSYKTLLNGNYIPNGYLIKSSIINNIEFTNEAPLEDYYLMLQLAKQGKFIYTDSILYSYRLHNKNTINKKLYLKLITYKTLYYEKQLIDKMPQTDMYIRFYSKYTLKLRIKFLLVKLLSFFKLI